MSNIYLRESVKRNKLLRAIEQEDIYKICVGRKDANAENEIVFVGVEHIFVIPADLNSAPEEITDDELEDMIENYEILTDFPIVKEFIDTVVSVLGRYCLDHKKEILEEMRGNFKRNWEYKRKLEEERELERKQEREAKKRTTKK